ncbi:snRNA-activating protein complex subunit 2 [Mugil cephalus]|uniref:snRNA-activating protein complex subunit 2 n=1 Tax=Mugil cephalus TaxID=48193 RepID=UPI001FB61649|nr:snRNA-activating protein complex subunit 2 [Mugil cephalus]
MKPPPRTRVKPDRFLKADPIRRRSRRAAEWKRSELRKLHDALKKLYKDGGHQGDMDYSYLRKHVPSRTTSEIHAVVESLKNKVISCATYNLQRNKRDDNKVKKPIEEWTHLASALAGSLEEVISSAFSQMLVVSSTEPCTLRNSDPPQAHIPPAEDRPIGRTVPWRPMPRQSVKQGQPLNTNTVSPHLQGKTPAPKTTRALPATIQAPKSNVHPPEETAPPTAETSSPSEPAASQKPPSQSLCTNQEQVSGSPTSAASVTPQDVCSPVAQATQESSEVHPVSIPTESTSKSTSSTSRPSSVQPETAHSTPAATYHTSFGRTSKFATKDCPRMFGVKCVVDFERIYCFLSVLQKPNEDTHLTPMESAIVLDLLMSLPEELQLLDCKALRKHMTQVYKRLSAPADSKKARRGSKNAKRGLSAQTEAQSIGDHNETSGQGTTAGTGDGERETPNPPESQDQTSCRSNTLSPTGDTNTMGNCPPLNPFMVPLKLLARK